MSFFVSCSGFDKEMDTYVLPRAWPHFLTYGLEMEKIADCMLQEAIGSVKRTKKGG
jgi:hypothetical protein